MAKKNNTFLYVLLGLGAYLLFSKSGTAGSVGAEEGSYSAVVLINGVATQVDIGCHLTSSAAFNFAVAQYGSANVQGTTFMSRGPCLATM